MKIVYQGGTGEIIEKKSRFIAAIHPAQTEEEACAFIAGIRKKYWDAKHNCSAFVIGKDSETTRCSDDGEPSQTAGRPMLEVLLREDIHNAVAVVTRYFGGVLLGTGGLVRAYQKAVQAGLSGCVLADRQSAKHLSICTDYHGFGRIQHILAQQDIAVLRTDYAADVLVGVLVPAGKEAALAEEITEKTGANARLIWGGETEFVKIGKEIKIFGKEC